MDSRKDPRDLHRSDFCGYSTKSLSIVLKHIRQYQAQLESDPNMFECHNNLPEVYKCEECDFASNLKVSLTQHSKLNHEEDPNNQNQFTNVMRQCEYCRFQTYSTLLLLKHNVDYCDDSEDLRSAERCKVINWLECEQCLYKTRKEYYLTRHIKRFHSTQFAWKEYLRKRKLVKYINKRNSLEYVYKDNLKKHTTNVHTDPENIVWYHCDKCKYKSKHKCNLWAHISRIHTDPANIVWHQCDKCEFITKRKPDLNKHIINIHTDPSKIVWYNCDKCAYKTKYIGDLRKHITNVHTDLTNIVWHHCDKCEYKTKQKYLLKRHTLTAHTDSASIVWYYCDICQFKSISKNRLEKHITNGQCKSNAKEEDNLKRHVPENVHTYSANIVRYYCDKCEFKSKWKITLQKHIANKHIDSSNIV